MTTSPDSRLVGLGDAPRETAVLDPQRDGSVGSLDSSTLRVMGNKNVWEDAKAEMQLSVQEVCDSEDYKALQAAGGEISFHQYEAIAAKLRNKKVKKVLDTIAARVEK